jgi:transmembrane protein EpsG
LLVLGNKTQQANTVLLENKEFIRWVPQRFVVVAFLMVLIFTSTIRYGFIDTYAYKYMYIAVRDNLGYIKTNGWGIEPGWLYILYILNFISRNPKLMLFLSALIINSAFVIGIYRRSSDVCFSLLIYYSMIFLNTNNGLRQFVAAAITILAFPLMQEKKYIRYILSIILASMLHQSALACILICFIASGKAFNIKIIVSIAAGIVFLVIPEPISNVLISMFDGSKYVDYLYMSNGMGIMRALFSGILPLFLAVIYVMNCRNKGRIISYKEGLLLNIMCLNSVFIIMGLNMQYWARFGFYTSFAGMIFLPQILRELFEKRNYQFASMIMVGCYLFFFTYNIYVNYIYGAMNSFYIDL